MQNPEMAFANKTGVELFHLLEQRAGEELSPQSPFDRYNAVLGAALIVVANVLREPVERGEDLDKLIAFSSHWLRVFLESVAAKGAEHSG